MVNMCLLSVTCQTKATTDLDGFVHCMRMGATKGRGGGKGVDIQGGRVGFGGLSDCLTVSPLLGHQPNVGISSHLLVPSNLNPVLLLFPQTHHMAVHEKFKS